MTITLFLLLSIAILIALWMLVCADRGTLFSGNSRQILKRHKGRWHFVYLLALFALGCMGVLTARHYIYPSDQQIFSNASYHVLSVNGFQINETDFALVNADYSGDFKPAQALWDDKEGYVHILDTAILVKHFFEPFYVKTGDGPYMLLNRYQSIAQQNKKEEKFVISQGDSVLLTLCIRAVDKVHADYVFTTSTSAQEYTSTFHRRINQGYLLSEILAKTPELNLDPTLEDDLQGCWLVRSSIDATKSPGMLSSQKNESPLVLFPNEALMLGGYIINSQNLFDAFDTTFSAPITDKAPILLFAGLGKNKTDALTLSYTNGFRTLLFDLPKMYSLRDNASRVFITSSTTDMASDSNQGGYLYNFFSRPDNINHCYASLRYIVGPANTNMSFVVSDMKLQEASDPVSVDADSPFYLSTEGGNKWICEVKNLRDNGPGFFFMTWRSLYLWVFIFVFLVGLRIVLDYFHKQHAVSVTEMAAYVVILSLWIVRLIIGWRVETFAPTDNITVAAFNKMRSSDVVDVTRLLAFYLLPLVMIVYSAYLRYKKNGTHHLRETIRQWWHTKSAKFEQKHPNSRLLAGLRKCRSFVQKCQHLLQSALHKPGPVTACFFLLLGICLLLAKTVSALTRLCNIAFPVLLLFVFDLWLTRMEQDAEDTRPWRKARIALYILTLGYLGVADAGFAIVMFIFVALHHLAISMLFKQEFRSKRFRNHRTLAASLPWCISVLTLVGIFFFYKYEGYLMLLVINHLEIVLLLMGLIMLLAGVALLIWKNKTSAEATMSARLRKSRFLRFVRNIFTPTGGRVAMTITGALLIVVVSLSIFSVWTAPIEYIEGKITHTKFRAEIQNLHKGESVEQLIKSCDYASDDIMFIMRSAHNQWFINQYLRMGEELDSYFHIQPHSNQGSTYTTQTTDLILTRYVIAEHGVFIVRLMLFLFLLQILIYCFEVPLQDPYCFSILGGLLLLYTIALSVFLSATNRIVFIGQDFPFLSVQSLMAVAFPVLLLMLPVLRTVQIRSDVHLNNKTDNGSLLGLRRIVLALGLSSLTYCCLWVIPEQGKEQDAEQFDLTRLVTNLKVDIEPINHWWENYQLQHASELRAQSGDETWNKFRNESVYANMIDGYLTELSDSFNIGAIRYFDQMQNRKTNPEALIHLRRRSGTYFLDVNRKYFFIPQIKDDSTAWSGNIYAAHVEPSVALSNQNGQSIRVAQDGDYAPNILPSAILAQAPNVIISSLGEEWTPAGQQLLIVGVECPESGRQNVRIEKDSITIQGYQFPSARLCQTDQLFVTKNDRQHRPITVIAGTLNSYSNTYLAKNIWVNGHQRLIYPLGEEMMWAYNYANLASQALGKNDSTRHQDIHLSIDYALHHDLYAFMQKQEANYRQNTTARDVYPTKVCDLLNEFAECSFEEQCNSHNKIWFDKSSRQIKSRGVNVARWDAACKTINTYIHTHSGEDELLLASAISQLTRRKYDFTAVAVDGNGRIRLLFDYKKGQHLDPNNIRYFSKTLSNIYMNGDNRTEREILGNKALQIMRGGPGSTFKPIIYTAITSQAELGWTGLNLSERNLSFNRKGSNDNTRLYYTYGGVTSRQSGVKKYNIDGGFSGLSADNYLVWSNNLYHSAIILMGLQPATQMRDILRDVPSAQFDSTYFPAFQFEGRLRAFDPDKWYSSTAPHLSFTRTNAINQGLDNLFRLSNQTVSGQLEHSSYGTDELMHVVANKKSNFAYWALPERSSINDVERQQTGVFGFLQLLKGGAPIEMTPLQMAVNAMRLASMNAADDITTLSDTVTAVRAYVPWQTKWNSQDAFFSFYKRQVLSQLHKVPTQGTAVNSRKFIGTARFNRLAADGLHIYCKTGTLTDEDSGNGRVDRSNDRKIKHLMVIIANRPLEDVSSLEELQKVKYYAVYLSYFGASDNVQDLHFGEIVDLISHSAVFNEYMFGNN